MPNSKHCRSLRLSASLALAFVVAPSVYAQTSIQRSPAQLADSVTNTLSQASIGIDLRIINANFFKGMSLEAGAVPKVEPSYIDGLYTRSDKIYVRLDGSIGNEILYAGGFHFGMAPNYDWEINFSRQFCKSKDAYMNFDFYESLPLDSNRALKSMVVGDYFSMKTKAGLIVTGGFLKALSSRFMVDISAHYLLSGSFQIHVLRLPDDKLRLKIVNLDTEEHGLSAGIGFSSVLEIFKIDIINRAANRILELNPLRISWNKGGHNLVLAEYDINIKDPTAQQVYDQTLQGSISIAKKFTKEFMKLDLTHIRDRLKDSILVNMEPLDQLAKADSQLPVAQARVIRTFKGDMESNYVNKTFHLGIAIAQINSGTKHTASKITSEKDGELAVHHQVATAVDSMDNSFLFSFIRVRKDATMASIIKTDVDGKNHEPGDFVIHVKGRQSRVQEMQYQAIKEDLSRTLPESLFKQIDFTGWKPNNNLRHKVYVEYQVAFHPEILDLLPSYSLAEIERRYQDFLDALPNQSTLYPETPAPKGDWIANEPLPRKPGYFAKRIAKQLAIFFDERHSAAFRHQAILSLQEEPLFLKTGIRFLIELLPQEPSVLKKLIYFRLAIDSKDNDKIRYDFGNRKASEIYDRLLVLQNLVENGGLDLRLEGEAVVKALACPVVKK